MTVSKSDTAIQQFAKDVNTMLTNNAVDGVGKWNLCYTSISLTMCRYRLGVPWW